MPVDLVADIINYLPIKQFVKKQNAVVRSKFGINKKKITGEKNRSRINIG